MLVCGEVVKDPIHFLDSRKLPKKILSVLDVLCTVCYNMYIPLCVVCLVFGHECG